VCGNNTSKVVPSCSLNYQNGCVDVCVPWDILDLFSTCENLRNIQIEITL